jgi:pimeloyl-ACP methyl ester carboxylesterase
VDRAPRAGTRHLAHRGLGDPAEAWQPQLDGLSARYLITTFANRGAGRTPLGEEHHLSATTMADDAAALLRALEVSSAHVAGFSMGSAIAQELALRHPELVRSLVLVSTYDRPDALFRSQLNFWRWLAEVAPSERAFFEAFFTWVYTPRAHADGTVDHIFGLPTPDPWRRPRQNPPPSPRTPPSRRPHAFIQHASYRLLSAHSPVNLKCVKGGNPAIYWSANKPT